MLVECERHRIEDNKSTELTLMNLKYLTLINDFNFNKSSTAEAFLNLKLMPDENLVVPKAFTIHHDVFCLRKKLPVGIQGGT
jgi:hypothetical protein